MKISENKVVVLHYAVSDSEDTLIYSSYDHSPLSIIQGTGYLIPGLEDALIDHVVGDKFEVEVSAENAYGDRHDEFVQTVPKSMFESVEDLAVGSQLRATTDDGEQTVIVIDVTDDEITVDGNHPLAGIDLQRKLEKNAFVIGGSNYDAPGQTVGDFLNGSGEGEFGDVVPSYKPGLKFTDLSKTLPPFAVAAIREAIPAFEKKIKGFSAKDATLTGVETRTSSPVSIKRGRDFQSISTKGLYPAGEGAGYAGGILSAGIDGIKVAEAMALSMLVKED